MAGLGIRLEAEDRMIINGAGIHFLTPAQIRLTNRANFLFGRQIMPPDEATTPARLIYYALQTAYVGTPEERVTALAEASLHIATFMQETTSAHAKFLLTEAMQATLAGDYYKAIRLARRVVRHEDAVLKQAASSIFSDESQEH
ncbi:flagellar biosynthesis regulator FlbT [Acetobacter estunensis NRIC 0472]|uniref:Flagellar biosynthesis repressor FlbT n=1 Tax=Acetobacter estunensis TaxID=104097 RepID=A0A967B8H0_9PROT|nr:flagellar biosynthesis repressor FlbT [Acetobacter estunensis]NHO53986.1 flagellar biosynthesis repressor FlbT [Acetobacter estunensis]GBQ20662.1 flagellar biosynthesis regulator FlbT [Acetobacter estunensis NRIC 0472]